MDWIMTPVGGVPFALWFTFFGGVIFGAWGWFTNWVWANWFSDYIWSEEQMTDILGEDIVRPHRRRR